MNDETGSSDDTINNLNQLLQQPVATASEYYSEYSDQSNDSSSETFVLSLKASIVLDFSQKFSFWW